MIMMKRIITGLLLVAVLFCGVAAAEEFGSLKVTVLDTSDSHSPVPNAEIGITAINGTYTNQQKTTLNGDGSVEFKSIPVGTYRVIISKEGYISEEKTIAVISQDDATSLNIFLSQDSPIMITVTDESSGKPIANAEVKVNNDEPKITDTYGRAFIVMARDASNSIQVTATSYLPYSETKYIKTSDTAITIPMTLAEAAPLLLIYNEAKSPVSGASVTVDGKIIAYTDSYGRAQLPTYTAGMVYPVKITCAGYNDYTEDITFTTDKTDYIISLTYASAQVKVTVKTESKVLPNAQVYFDGTNKGVTGEDGTFTANAEPGTTILISASLDGYNGESVTCNVEAKSTNEATILMKENFPTTLVGLGALAAIIVLLIVILLIVGKNRINKGKKNTSGYPSHGPTRRRDSL